MTGIFNAQYSRLSNARVVKTNLIKDSESPQYFSPSSDNRFYLLIAKDNLCYSAWNMTPLWCCFVKTPQAKTFDVNEPK